MTPARPEPAREPSPPRALLVYHFCRLQLPTVGVSVQSFSQHLQRMYGLARAKADGLTWERFLEGLYPVDAFLVCACLEGNERGWEVLFAARAGRADRLLVDALRARAVRLFPRDEERQDSEVAEFWGHLIVPDAPGRLPTLARYDGQRPLVPWLILTFQNWLISKLRAPDQRRTTLPPDAPDPFPPRDGDLRWHEAFCEAARAWLAQLGEQDLLLLGLRLRYRLSQRDVAGLLGVHEGTISRQITQLRENCHGFVGQRLLAEGWDGDDLTGFIHSERADLLMDEPRLSADHLARLLAARGKTLPAPAEG